MDEKSESRIRRFLAGNDEVMLGYLFGSRVSGRVGPMSDYDFALFLSGRPEDPDFRYNVAHELTMRLPSGNADLLLLNEAPIELAYAVIAQGRCLFARSAVIRVEYEAYVLSRYGDYLPVLRAQRQTLIEGEPYETRVRRYRAADRRITDTLAKIRALQAHVQG